MNHSSQSSNDENIRQRKETDRLAREGQARARIRDDQRRAEQKATLWKSGPRQTDFLDDVDDKAAKKATTQLDLFTPSVRDNYR
jgi:hypothetical protein